MDAVQPYIDAAMAFVNNGYSQVNGPIGLLIALLAVLIMKGWRQLLAITLGATVAYALVEAVRPIVLEGRAVALPPVTDPNYLITLASLYVGLLVIIAMFFAVKKVVFLRDGGGAKAKAH